MTLQVSSYKTEDANIEQAGMSGKVSHLPIFW